jgi:penicillin amidase
VLLTMLIPAAVAQEERAPGGRFEIEGLEKVAEVWTDSDGIPHIRARRDHDLFFMQGYVHARDRFFQMDYQRRIGSGTLAELLGDAALNSDVQFRTAMLEAYADGVNAWLEANPLPPEYGPLELTAAAPWTAVDSLVITKLIAFSLSFDLDDLDRTVALSAFAQVGNAAGFDGVALFTDDLYRSAPFDPTISIPGSGLSARRSDELSNFGEGVDFIRPETIDLVREYTAEAEDVPVLADALRRSDSLVGSNEWAIGGSLTAGGQPLLANDPHLALNTPSTFYQIHLNNVADRLDAIGSSFPGAPGLVLGQNRWMAWGATVNPLDVTDVYQETVVADTESPSGLSTIFDGSPEPIIPIPEEFRANVIGDSTADNVVVVPPGGGIPAATLIVPRRNQGPIITIGGAPPTTALSVQYTGWSPTREVDTFRLWLRARDLDDFRDALQFFDVGSENWSYADSDGNIAYFTSAELPVREDLQLLGFPDGGIPPYFIRDGSHTLQHEWLAVQNPQPGQAVPFEILPFAEMPQVVNPAAGYVINANNDPVGTTLDNDPLNQARSGGGLYYLNPGYATGFRAGRIQRLVDDAIATGPIDRDDMQRIQANTQLLDAEVLTPYILEAWNNAATPGADPALAAFIADPDVGEAIVRLALWDYSTPTGIPEGYDASDPDGQLQPPTAGEIEASIAATIYSTWRGQAVQRIIDGTLTPLGLDGFAPGSSQSMSALRNLLDSFDANQGVGASGIDFFVVPGVGDAADERDVILLQALRDALDLLAGPDFAPAFGGSTNQDDYRWGYLHRIVLDHPLGGPFDVPPAGGAFPAPLPGLPGVPVDGGFGAVDASSHSARADGVNEFMFGSGPVRRYVGGPLRTGRISGESSLPGGESGVLGSPFYANLLPTWLSNDTHPHRQTPNEVRNDALTRDVYRGG